MKFKKCPACGYVHLTRKEKIIIDMMPTTSIDVAKKFKRSVKQSLVELKRLEKLGIIFRSIKQGKCFLYVMR